MKLIIILTILFLLAGCSGGSSGLGLFGGSSGNDSGGSSTGDTNISLVHQPEPSSLALLGVGLAGLAVAVLRKRKKL
ncbi:MAG: hypothetical protein A2166_00475 [Omnitrophica WOR_2 bacterium RBG_13_41_10]|nr:MAG: hypothetical protein A2166_00475 [Omnitrophica WOR_2 bacterium RBG_13_41_10]